LTAKDYDILPVHEIISPSSE